jgi:hypothetical protein
MDEAIKKRIEDYARNHSSAPDKETPDWIIRDIEYGYGLAQEEIEQLKTPHYQMAFMRVEELKAKIARLTAQNEKMRGLLKECLPLVRFSKEHPGDIKDEEYREKFEARHEVLKISIESILNDK